VTDGGVIVGQRLCGEWKSTQPRPDGWRIIFLITFWRPLQATPASAEEHPPSGEHRLAASLPQISGYPRRRDAAGQARLRLCLHGFIEVFAELLLPSTVHVTSAGVVHGKSWGCQCAHTSSLLLPRQNHQPATFPSPAAEKSKDQPLHTITSAKHQPNISQTSAKHHLAESSPAVFIPSICSLGMFSSQYFLPFFLLPSSCFHSPTRAEVMTPSSNQSRVTVFTCSCTISACMWWKSSGATKDVVALQILSDHLKSLEVGLMGCEWSVLFPRSETGRH
jgi:hypothetical protein